MQIKSIQSQKKASNADDKIFEHYIEAVEKYDKAFLIQIADETFVAKPLGRKDYKDVMNNEALNTYDKEEVICEICTVYPEEYDFSTCEAGIPSQLSEKILYYSYLDSTGFERATSVINYFRSEMAQLHNQINCLISEAFPNLDFEAIENWDIEKTLRYLSRSEWILQNLRGIEMQIDPFTGKSWDEEVVQKNTPDSATVEELEASGPQLVTHSLGDENTDEEAGNFISGETIEERLQRLNEGKIKKQPLTLDKLRELQRKVPEIDWTAKLTEQDFKVNVDDTPYPLR